MAISYIEPLKRWRGDRWLWKWFGGRKHWEEANNEMCGMFTLD